MSAINDSSNAFARKSFGAQVLNKIVLALNAATAATVKTTNVIEYAIDGIVYSKAVLAAQPIAITHDCFGQPIGGANLPAYVQPALKTAYLLLCVNAAGAIAVAQGSYLGQVLAYADLQRILTGTGAIPTEPDGYTAFGLMKIVTTGAATFTPGTTALDAANVGVTYYDLTRVPSVAP